jgi:putative aldouronate transport system permease protein
VEAFLEQGKLTDAQMIKKKKSTAIWNKMKQQRWLYLMILPGFLCALVFNYGPMFGLYMAFINYSPGGGAFFYQFFHSDFIGLQWFEYFYTSGDFFPVLRNTLAQGMLTLLFLFPAPIILAIAINEVRLRFFKRTIQTISYFPYFISWVIAANIIITMLSSEGPVNQLLMALHLVDKPILFFQNGHMFWGIIGFSNAWKDFGFNAIIYLAAIAGINSELYEAARVDGANRWKQMLNVTLPALTPTILILSILSLAKVIDAGFEQQLLLQNTTILQYSDVIDTYAYRYGLQNGMLSYGAAVGMFKSVVAFVLVMSVNAWSRKVHQQSLY